MALTFRKLHPHFVGEVGPIDLRRVHDPETLAEIRAGMDEYAILVFRDQPLHRRRAARLRPAPGRRAPHQAREQRDPEEPLRQRGARRHLEPGRERRDHEVRRPAPHVRARQPALAHRRVLPGSARPLLDALGQGRPAGGRGHRVRRHARGLRRAPRRDEGAARGPARAPLDRLLPPDARLRVLGERGRTRSRARSIRSSARIPRSQPPLALRRLARVADHRLAGARGPPAAARPDRARHPAPSSSTATSGAWATS